VFDGLRRKLLLTFFVSRHPLLHGSADEAAVKLGDFNHLPRGEALTRFGMSADSGLTGFSHAAVLGNIRFQTPVSPDFTPCVCSNLQWAFWRGFQTPPIHAPNAPTGRVNFPQADFGSGTIPVCS
jgi:hypothetical protein